MGKKLLLIVLFSILAVLVAGHYGLVPTPWLEGGIGALDSRDAFVNKSADVLESNSD